MTFGKSTVRVEVEGEEQSFLEREGLACFADVMERSDCVAVKTVLPHRHVHSLELSDGRTVFIKRYFSIPWFQALRNLLSGGGWSSPARREWNALRVVNQLGIPTTTPLALGEESRGGLVRRAFVITWGVESDGSLETWMYRHLDGVPTRESVVAKRRFVERAAKFLRGMHEGGVNHRDFYLGHLLHRENGDGLWVVDFDRADVREHVPRRWRVKDVAALLASAAPRFVTRTDQLRFLRIYFGERRIDRAFVRDVVFRALRVRGRSRRKAELGVPNFHVND